MFTIRPPAKSSIATSPRKPMRNVSNGQTGSPTHRLAVHESDQTIRPSKSEATLAAYTGTKGPPKLRLSRRSTFASLSRAAKSAEKEAPTESANSPPAKAGRSSESPKTSIHACWPSSPLRDAGTAQTRIGKGGAGSNSGKSSKNQLSPFRKAIKQSSSQDPPLNASASFLDHARPTSICVVPSTSSPDFVSQEQSIATSKNRFAAIANVSKRTSFSCINTSRDPAGMQGSSGKAWAASIEIQGLHRTQDVTKPYKLYYPTDWYYSAFCSPSTTMRSPRPVQLIDVTTSWTGLNDSIIEEVSRIHDAFVNTVEELFQGRLCDIYDELRHIANQGYARKPFTAVMEHCVTFFPWQLTDFITQKLYDLVPQENIAMIPVGKLALYLASTDCLSDLSSNGHQKDACLSVNTHYNKTDPLGNTHVTATWVPDAILFNKFDTRPQEGQELVIFPQYHCSSPFRLPNDCKSITFSTNADWLVWYKAEACYRGRVPHISTLRGEQAERDPQAGQSKSSGYALEIDIKAIMCQHAWDASKNPLRVERIINSRLQLTVVPRRYQSAHNDASIGQSDIAAVSRSLTLSMAHLSGLFRRQASLAASIAVTNRQDAEALSPCLGLSDILTDSSKDASSAFKNIECPMTFQSKDATSPTDVTMPCQSARAHQCKIATKSEASGPIQLADEVPKSAFESTTSLRDIEAVQHPANMTAQEDQSQKPTVSDPQTKDDNLLCSSIPGQSQMRPFHGQPFAQKDRSPSEQDPPASSTGRKKPGRRVRFENNVPTNSTSDADECSTASLPDDSLHVPVAAKSSHGISSDSDHDLDPAQFDEKGEHGSVQQDTIAFPECLLEDDIGNGHKAQNLPGTKADFDDVDAEAQRAIWESYHAGNCSEGSEASSEAGPKLGQDEEIALEEACKRSLEDEKAKEVWDDLFFGSGDDTDDDEAYGSLEENVED